MSASYEEQKEEELQEMFKEEAQEALREHPSKSVDNSNNGDEGLSRSKADNGGVVGAPVGPPKVIQVVTPISPTMLIVALEQCLEAYNHLNQVEGAEHAREDALEYIFNRHYGRTR
jgi:hypothetical protein